MSKKLKIKKINNFEVKPIPLDEIPNTKETVLGYDMFREPYSNILMIAQKKSGKTTVIYNILKNCIDKYTKIYLFVPTFFNDSSYEEIRKYLDKKKIQYFHLDDVNFLQVIIKELQDEAKPQEKEEKKRPVLIFNEKSRTEDEEGDKLEKKRNKRRNKTPNNLFIFDDCSDQIKNNRILTALAKMNRHFKSKVIISTQYYSDIPVGVRNNADYILLFKNLNDKTLESLVSIAPLQLDIDEFTELYHKVTEGKYNFLYMDIKDNEYRKNFNEILEPEGED